MYEMLRGLHMIMVDKVLKNNKSMACSEFVDIV